MRFRFYIFDVDVYSCLSGNSTSAGSLGYRYIEVQHTFLLGRLHPELRVRARFEDVRHL